MKGYLGAIGDDFPSIFPLALGLMFFFSAVTMAYADYNHKSELVLLMRSNTAMSKGLRSQILFDGAQWQEACELLVSSKVNYGVQAQIRLVDLSSGESIYALSDYQGFPRCGDLSNEDGEELPLENDFVVGMTYPVLVQKDSEALPASLVVMTWK